MRKIVSGVPLHADESVEKKIGRSPEGLALEQFFFLLEMQTESGPYRPRQLRTSAGKTNPSDPSTNREGSGSRKFKIAQRLAHPAWPCLRMVGVCSCSRGRAATVPPWHPERQEYPSTWTDVSIQPYPLVHGMKCCSRVANSLNDETSRRKPGGPQN